MESYSSLTTIIALFFMAVIPIALIIVAYKVGHKKGRIQGRQEAMLEDKHSG